MVRRPIPIERYLKASKYLFIQSLITNQQLIYVTLLCTKMQIELRGNYNVIDIIDT